MSRIRYGKINKYHGSLFLHVLGHPVVTPSIWYQPLKLTDLFWGQADNVLVSVKGNKSNAYGDALNGKRSRRQSER